MEAIDVGLFALRVVLGLICIGHGLRKTTGWLQGPGLPMAAAAFEAAGYRPGRPLVLMASASELAGGILILTGLMWPLGCVIIVATLLVACSTHTQNGFWASGGGFELPFTYVAIATGLLFAGHGALALGPVVDLTLGQLALVWVLGVAGAAALVGYRAALRRAGSTVIGRELP